MRSSRLGRRPAWGLLVGLLFVTFPARADDAKRACTHAYEQGQRLKQSGALTAAREHLVMCGGSSCPSVMHADCERWLSEVEASLPTVVFQVRSNQAGEVTRARVSVDGKPPVTLVGRAIGLDPGEHEVRFLADGYAPLVRRYFFTEGQKLRRETVTLTPTTPSDDEATPSDDQAQASSTESSASTSTVVPERVSSAGRIGLPFILASSVAALGAGSFVYFGLSAREKDRALGSCEPQCSRGDIDATRDRYLYANIALGVGAAGLITAVVLYLVHPSQPSAAASRPVGQRSAAGAPSSGLRGLRVGELAGPATASVQFSF